ncbi:MAG: hypothetical protein EKK55_12410 [Rhodocyclaceae bacterium]|nr:MAG: hypothetical protein EKK55_12410 [Rhodocyclaceae bacterium]
MTITIRRPASGRYTITRHDTGAVFEVLVLRDDPRGLRGRTTVQRGRYVSGAYNLGGRLLHLLADGGAVLSASDDGAPSDGHAALMTWPRPAREVA